MSDHHLMRDPYVAAFPELLPFWEAADRGVLLLPRCTQCGETHWHPRAQCPFCRSDELRWEQASGLGTLHTFTVIRRGEAAPDLLAYVRLQEGPLLLTSIVDAAPEALHIGMAVQLGFRIAPGGRRAPVFQPAATV